VKAEDADVRLAQERLAATALDDGSECGGSMCVVAFVRCRVIFDTASPHAIDPIPLTPTCSGAIASSCKAALFIRRQMCSHQKAIYAAEAPAACATRWVPASPACGHSLH
jgi:hypothetical protein